MLQAVMTAPGKIMFHEVGNPKTQVGQVLFQMKRIGLCSSDFFVVEQKKYYLCLKILTLSRPQW